MGGAASPPPPNGDSAHEGPVRRLLESPHVLGVGAGVFVLGFFLVTSIILCLVGSRTRKPWIVCAASVAMLTIVAAVLLGTPKGQRPPPAPQGYDRTIVPMALTGVLVSAGVGVSAASMLAFHAAAPVYARLLSYRTDVLGWP